MLEYLFDFYKGKSKRIRIKSPEDINKKPKYITEYELLTKLLELKERSINIWVVIIGLGHYHGTEPFKMGDTVHLVKEPGNYYDPYAIMAICDGVGKCGYIANSRSTVRDVTLSAEFLHGGVSDSCTAEVVDIDTEYILCRINGINYLDLIFNYGVNFYRENKISNAMMFFEAIEDEYQTLEMFQRMSMCYLHFCNFIKAREYADKALELDKNNLLTQRILKEIQNKLNS